MYIVAITELAVLSHQKNLPFMYLADFLILMIENK